MKLPAGLRKRSAVVVDTMVFIYYFEDSPGYGETAAFLIDQVTRGGFEGVVTPISLAEVVVKPLEHGRSDLADQYRSFMTATRGLNPANFTMEEAHMAGALRAKYGLPLPDMMQAATAMRGNPKKPAIITNDKAFLRVEELEVFLLDELV